MILRRRVARKHRRVSTAWRRLIGEGFLSSTRICCGGASKEATCLPCATDGSPGSTPAKVDELDRAVSVGGDNEDVGRLHVAVDDPSSVQLRKRAQKLPQHLPAILQFSNRPQPSPASGEPLPSSHTIPSR